MSQQRYVYWQDGEMYLGYFEEFPDYMSQDKSLEEFQDNLKDIYAELTGGHIPSVQGTLNSLSGRVSASK